MAVQVNRLVGPETLESTLEAFLEHRDREFAERLLLALDEAEGFHVHETGELRTG